MGADPQLPPLPSPDHHLTQIASRPALLSTPPLACIDRAFDPPLGPPLPVRPLPHALPLRRWLLHAAAAPRLDASAAWTFRRFAGYVVVIWHLHPLAWTLAATGVVSERAEHLIWELADFLSKSLPLLVFARFATEKLG